MSIWRYLSIKQPVNQKWSTNGVQDTRSKEHETNLNSIKNNTIDQELCGYRTRQGCANQVLRQVAEKACVKEGARFIW